MVKLSVHNVIAVGLIAVVVLWVLKRLAGTGLANVPILGQALGLAKAA